MARMSNEDELKRKNLCLIKTGERHVAYIIELEAQVLKLVRLVRDCHQVFDDIAEMGGVDGHILACMQEHTETELAKHEGDG